MSHEIEGYLQGLKSYKFNRGDIVRVLRSAKDGEAGWQNSWEKEMDQYVGRCGIIVSDEDTGAGFNLSFEDSSPSTFGFPYFVLSRVDIRPGKINTSPAPLLSPLSVMAFPLLTPGGPSVEKSVKYEDPTADELIHILRRRFPYGHPRFIPLTLDEMQLHSKKNHDYAHGGKPTGNFDRVAKILSMYPGINVSKPQNVAVVYLLKQLDAALWLESQGHTAEVQGADERWQDISVYAKIIMLLLGEKESEQK